MAITFLNVRVSNPADPQKGKVIEFLVDSGAVYSVMPQDELKKLGIPPTSNEEFILANGEKLRMPVGNAFFEYQGKTRAAPIVFGAKDVYLLGATTIEALGMILDPIHRELKPLPMVLMHASDNAKV
jgi:clan AA aspartic protease